AVDSLIVRARVTGYLDAIRFKEGAEVKKDDLLFEIDPRPYQAVLNQAQAQMALQEANLKFQEAVYQRNAKLFASKAVSQDELQQSLAQRDQTLASVNAANATVEQA